MKAVGKSHVGRKRVRNEDCFYISENETSLGRLFIIADGMGGANGGNVASSLAVSAFLDFFNKEVEKNEPNPEILDILVEGIKISNDTVYGAAQNDINLDGMGTTFTVLIIKDSKAYIGHIGDSRLYIIKKENIYQITKDHSYVMELLRMGKIKESEIKNHPGRNVITRALGTSETVETDTYMVELDKDFVILMCSDGLYNMVDEDDIIEIMEKDLTLDDKASLLIYEANENGGFDNISVIIICGEDK